jgi:hypothetical protein
MFKAKNLFFAASMFASLSIPAVANPTVTTPNNGASVGSPFSLSANAGTCSSQPVSAMGYSLDSSSQTAIVSGASVNAQVQSSAGSHVLHVKSWGNKGSVCVTDVSITVTSLTSAITDSLVVPTDALLVSSIQVLSGWSSVHDTGAPGASSGWMSLVNSPSRSGNARKFVTAFSNFGDNRYSNSFGDDTTSTNFLYDAWVYIASPSTMIGNLEFDLNQTMENGQTVILGVQCDGYASRWDYTVNKGTPQNPNDQWQSSSAYCNPRGWSTNVWHHVQISYSRDDSGVVTYHAVWLDGLEEPINATVSSAFALGWSPTLLTNFQVDGLGSAGTSTVYLDELVVYRW